MLNQASGTKPFSCIWKHSIIPNKGVISWSIFSCNFDDKVSPNVHRFLILCIYNKWGYNGLRQLPKVDPAFKLVIKLIGSLILFVLGQFGAYFIIGNLSLFIYFLFMFFLISIFCFFFLFALPLYHSFREKKSLSERQQTISNWFDHP